MYISIMKKEWWKRVWREARYQVQNIALPTLSASVTDKLVWLVSLHFVGTYYCSNNEIGAQTLAAASLATTLFNITGMSISVGLSSAVYTLTGQARGQQQVQIMQQQQKKQQIHTDDSQILNEQEYLLKQQRHPENDSSSYYLFQDMNLPLVVLFRALAIQFIFIFPVGLYWIYGSSHLQRVISLDFGHSSSTVSTTTISLARSTCRYLQVSAPGLWANSFYRTIAAWLQSMELASISAMASLVGLCCHLLLNLVLLQVTKSTHLSSFLFGRDNNGEEEDNGYLTVALATTLTQCIQSLFILWYIGCNSKGRNEFRRHVLLLQSTNNTLTRKKPDDDLENDHYHDKHLSLMDDTQRNTSNKMLNMIFLALCNRAGLLEFLSLALPGIVLISEWWASEVVIFLSGHLPRNANVAVGSMAILQSINTICFMFPMSFSVAGTARIGHCLGREGAADESELKVNNEAATKQDNVEKSITTTTEHHDDVNNNHCLLSNDDRDEASNNKMSLLEDGIEGAHLAAQTSTLVAVGSSLVLAISLGFIIPHWWIPRLFTHQAKVIQQTSELIPFLAIYIVGDSLQAAMSGIIKACGKQCIAMPIVVFSYWCIGVPLSYILAFQQGSTCDSLSFDDNGDTTTRGFWAETTCGVKGLVLGTTTATWVHALLFVIIVATTIQWAQEAIKAKERLAKDTMAKLSFS